MSIEAEMNRLLKVEESALIARWNLCIVGWNRKARSTTS